jgi:hypothetical protein
MSKVLMFIFIRDYRALHDIFDRKVEIIFYS